MKAVSVVVLVTIVFVLVQFVFSPALADSQGSRFTVDENGIATDKQTGYQWVAGPDQDIDWHTAKQWVETLELDGGGWRMPEITELKKLFEFGELDFIPYKGKTFWSGDALDPSEEEILVYTPEMGFDAPVPPYIATFNRALAVRSPE